LENPVISVIETFTCIVDVEKLLTEAKREAVIDVMAANPLD
jgi:hypothetical protein